VRIIHGDQDGIAPLAMAHYLQDQLPRATLEVVAGAGHLIAADVEDFVSERLKHILSTDVVGQVSHAVDDAYLPVKPPCLRRGG
jgi:hypothetical protein